MKDKIFVHQTEGGYFFITGLLGIEEKLITESSLDNFVKSFTRLLWDTYETNATIQNLEVIFPREIKMIYHAGAPTGLHPVREKDIREIISLLQAT